MTRMKAQLSDTNHQLSQLQTFRSSVARFLHLRDVPHAGILQRLQTLCNAHQVRIKFLGKQNLILNLCNSTRSSHYCQDGMSQRHQSVNIPAHDTMISFRHRCTVAL